jgi:hypothetical protein
MKRYSYDVRLILMAGILSSLALIVFPKGPFHVFLDCLVIMLLASGLVLMFLRKTGKFDWNGPNWGKRLQPSPALKRVLVLVPALCAALVPILFLMNRSWGLSDKRLGIACGVLVGISFSVLVKIKSKGESCCGPLEDVATQQSGTK